MDTKTSNSTKKPAFQKLIDLADDKINVLVLGTSGAGKSTLINAIMHVNTAKTGAGNAVTDAITVYEDVDIPFRMIDTVGFEYGFFRQNKIKHDLARFCKEGIKRVEPEKLIHMIWFCIDGTIKRIDQQVLEYTRSITADWKDVPIIIVFTKSYSEPDVAENMSMAAKAVQIYNLNHSRAPLNVKEIIPVIAKEYAINDTYIVPQKGLDVLISKTNELAPDAKRLANKTIKEIDIKLKNGISSSMIAGATAAAATVGAVPIPIPDAPALISIQTGLLKSLTNIYDIHDDSAINNIINTTLSVGATTTIGKSMLVGLKSIPGINIAASVMNALVAGIVTFSIGEACKVMCVKVYSGELDSTIIDYEKEIAETYRKYAPRVLKGVEEFFRSHKGQFTLNDITKFLSTLIKTIE